MVACRHPRPKRELKKTGLERRCGAEQNACNQSKPRQHKSPSREALAMLSRDFFHFKKSSAPQYRQRRELLAEDRLARRLQPVLKHGRVDASEIYVVLQVALIQVRQGR